MSNKAIKYGDGVRIHCPSCKEYIIAHANKCPFCHYDLTCDEYFQITKWHSTAVKVLLFISGFMFLVFISSGTPFILCLILCFLIFLFSYFIVLKIQSFKNDII